MCGCCPSSHIFSNCVKNSKNRIPKILLTCNLISSDSTFSENFLKLFVKTKELAQRQCFTYDSIEWCDWNERWVTIDEFELFNNSARYSFNKYVHDRPMMSFSLSTESTNLQRRLVSTQFHDKKTFVFLLFSSLSIVTITYNDWCVFLECFFYFCRNAILIRNGWTHNCNWKSGEKERKIFYGAYFSSSHRNVFTNPLMHGSTENKQFLSLKRS